MSHGLGGPAARRLAEKTRPAGTDDLFVAWETLTHAGDPAACTNACALCPADDVHWFHRRGVEQLGSSLGS